MQFSCGCLLSCSSVRFKIVVSSEEDHLVTGRYMQKEILFKIANLRVLLFRIFGFLVVAVILLTGQTIDPNSIADDLFEIFGLFFLMVCSFGRLWALLYISGNKRRELITDGPYSITRNPLYVFSLIGSVGIGLVSENVLVLVLVMLFYLVYYPFTILAEEEKLTAKFGQPYSEYKNRTPRFFPKFSLYQSPDVYEVKANVFVQNFMKGMWFLGIFILLHFIEMLQESGVLPVLWKLR